MKKTFIKSFFVAIIGLFLMFFSVSLTFAQTNDTWLELLEHPELYLGGIIVIVMTITLIVAILWRKKR